MHFSRGPKFRAARRCWLGGERREREEREEEERERKEREKRRETFRLARGIGRQKVQKGIPRGQKCTEASFAERGEFAERETTGFPFPIAQWARRRTTTAFSSLNNSKRKPKVRQSNFPHHHFVICPSIHWMRWAFSDGRPFPGFSEAAGN